MTPSNEIRKQVVGTVFSVERAERVNEAIEEEMKDREHQAYARFRDEAKQHFGTNMKLEGVSWTLNEVIDAIYQKLTGDTP